MKGGNGLILFGKEVKVKNYGCSCDPDYIISPVKPRLNLYIQSQEKCNACCDICNPGCISTRFDYEKLKSVLSELEGSGLTSKVSVTGGEPLMDMERTTMIARMLNEFRFHTALNTNAYDTGRLTDAYGLFDTVYISRHHYDNDMNDEIMGIRTPCISMLSRHDTEGKIIINCVLQKGYIDSADKIKEYMEHIGMTGIRKIRFISPYGLTPAAERKMIPVEPIIEEFMKNTNSGVLYDRHNCSCLDFMYVTSAGTVVNGVIKNNMTCRFDCCRQLVYNGEYLYDGFEKRQVII